MVKKVAVKTTDLKTAYHLINELKKLNVNVAEEGNIEITDELVKKMDLNKLVGYILCKVRGKEIFNELLIGIDTNKEEKLTVVAIGDGELLLTLNCNLMDIEDKIRKIVSSIPHKKLYIGVGGGNKIGQLVYKMLKMSFKDVKIVDEDRTSRENPFINIKDKDIRAAYLIALRSTIR